MTMFLISIGALLYLVNVLLPIILASIIIDKLYISKKFSKENDFHFYNDLFSWEIFFFTIAAENLFKIIIVLFVQDIILTEFLLRIRILILFFPFWNKIIHLEKIMNKITYEKHYFGGIIPLVIVFLLFLSGLPCNILIVFFILTTFIPYLLFLLLLPNEDSSFRKSIKVIMGVLLIGFSYIFRPEMNFFGVLNNILAAMILIFGTLLIFDSFRKELIS